MGGTKSNINLGLDPETIIKNDKPKMYAVIMHNDDYTPMDFVVYLLVKVFRKDDIDARMLMLDIHQKGAAAIGIYTFDVASSKQDLVQKMAEQAGHPLRITIKEAE